MIITCPNCQTNYQVADKAIGSAGRKVQCAQCHQSWQARAQPMPQPERPRPKLVEKPAPDKEDDKLFSPKDEEKLDKDLESEADRNAPPPKDGGAATPAENEKTRLQKKRFTNMMRRQKAFLSNLPMARMHRAMRWIGALLLIGIFASGYFFRTAIVRAVPDMAGLYDMVGLGVNIVGLEFRDVRTIKSAINGTESLVVSATIVNVAAGQVPVPQIIITLLDDEGSTLFEWTALPEPRFMSAGEIYRFETKAAKPPRGFTRARLRFAGPNAHSGAADAKNQKSGE